MSLDKMTIGGRCGYAEPDDAVGSIQCENIGLRVIVQDPLGGYHSVVRCENHSDWVEAPHD